VWCGRARDVAILAIVAFVLVTGLLSVRVLHRSDQQRGMGRLPAVPSPAD